MLKELIADGFGIDNKYNCAEKIIHGANKAYNLGLDADALRMFAAFGGGMTVGETCGAVCSGLGVISHLFVKDTAVNSTLLRKISQEFITEFENRMGTLNCKELTKKYASDSPKCQSILENTCDIIDQMIVKYAEQIAAVAEGGKGTLPGNPA